MDKFEEIGRRIDEELTRLRRYLEEEVGPETERRTAVFLRDVSGKLSEGASKLSDAASKLEARRAARSEAAQAPPESRDHDAGG